MNKGNKQQQLAHRVNNQIFLLFAVKSKIVFTSLKTAINTSKQF